MQNSRFYDTDADFLAFMTIFESMSSELQEEIANDIILNISRFVYKNNDTLLNDVKNTSSYKRWYDKNLIVHSAIEELKKLNKKTRDEMIASVSDIIFQNLGQRK